MVAASKANTRPESVQAELEHALKISGSAGDKRAQAESCVAVLVAYMGESPGDEARSWWDEREKALVGGKGIIDIRKMTAYQKLHSKTSCVTLERALLSKASSNDKLRRYVRSVEKILRDLDLPLAASAW